MATIDEIGRAAGRAVMDEAADAVDVEHELERVHAGRETARAGASVGRRRTALMATAAVLVIAVVVAIGVVVGRDGSESIVTEDPPPPSSTIRPELVDVLELDFGGADRRNTIPAAVSPDGRWIAHQGPNDAVCLTSLTESAAPWCEQIDGFLFGQLSWSPDSTRFTGGDEVVFGQEWRTVVVDIDGSWDTLDLAIEGEPGAAGPLLRAAFAGDGRSIVGILAPDDDSGVPSRLALVDADTGDTRVLRSYPGPFSGNLSQPPLPIDENRSVLFGSDDLDIPDGMMVRADSALLVLDHTDGSITLIDLPVDVPAHIGLPRAALDVTASGSTVLVGRSRLVPRADGESALAPYVDLELWDIDDASVSRLPVAPDELTERGSAISPDGAHVTSAWVTADGVLELGIATVADLIVLGGETWDPDVWSVTTLAATLADGPIDGLDQSFRDIRPVCWCGDRIFVVAGEAVHIVEPVSAVGDR